MKITSSLRMSLKATGNSAFEARGDLVTDSLREGNSIAESLTKTRIFPEEFLNIVAVAEESGRVPEVMVHQTEYYEEQASRTLTALTRASAYAVYATYIVLMVLAIYRIYSGTYLAMLNQF